MPQLDKVTFLGQFFWTTVIFFGFYFTLLKIFLPPISRILKYREKKLNSSSEETSSIVGKEILLISTTNDTIISTTLQRALTSLKNLFLTFTNWVKLTSTELDKTRYQKSNLKYLNRFIETSLYEKIQKSQPSFPVHHPPISHSFFNLLKSSQN